MKKQRKVKLILSCDTKNEIDDQFAIYYALKSPEIELLGVVSTQNTRRNGENSVDIYHEEAKKIIRLAKSKIPCHKGSRRPLNKKNLENSAGVKFIVDNILKSKDKIIVASTGPCTDLANALLLEPKIARRANFIWLGGSQKEVSKYLQNSREVNFLGDPSAAQILLNKKINLVLIPAWGVADCLVLNTRIFAEKLKSRNLPITNYLASLIDSNWKRIGLVHYLLPKILTQYWAMCDVAAIAVAKNFGASDFSNSKNIKIIYRIEEHKILSQFENYILK